jgi:hypothetical protein
MRGDYEMEHKLKTKHLFPFIRMVRALKLKEEAKGFMELLKTENKSLQDLDDEKGMDFFFIFIDKMADAEDEVLHFVSLFVDKSRTEVDEMELMEVWEILKQLFKDPNLKVFFTQALKQTK